MRPAIHAGQVWRSRDRRETREVVVQSNDGHFVWAQNRGTGRSSRLRVQTLLDRFEYVEEAAS